MTQKTFTGKGNLFLFVFFLSFFFISLVSAQPPPQTNVNTDIGYDISYPKYEVIKVNQPFNLSIHLFNRSDGLPIYSPICELEIYDAKGIHLIDEELTLVGEDYSYYILGGNFSEVGLYSFNIICNSTDFGGFVDGIFEATPTGFSDIFDFYIIILLISAVLIIWGFKIEDPWVIIFGTFGLYFTGLYIMLNGIVGIKDMVTTWAIALILLGVAAYISFKAGLEVVNG